jgi:hypothetical protein
MTTSAAVILALGLIHIVYTFRGHKLYPRDSALQQTMQQVSPVISRETTMWKVWIGVNATHSLALILFGLIYGYLALLNTEFLFNSPALLTIGLAMLLSLSVLSRLYFFTIPFSAICLSTLFYLASIAFSRWSQR